MILKSTGAVLAGLLFIAISHTIADTILHATGVLPAGHFYVETWLILIVIAYRAVLSVVGCYITARLAPKKPMMHALILGGIGVVLSTLGAVANAQLDLGPSWYAWTLVVLALPLAYLGGKLYEKQSTPAAPVVAND